MIIDYLSGAHKYAHLGERFRKAFDYLTETDFRTVKSGRYEVDGEFIFAMVNEYDTVDPSGEKMESHKAHIDVQYIVEGAERVGHGFLLGQQPSQAYDPGTDFMLFAEPPVFFSLFSGGMFAIFFPEDLHMPNIMINQPAPVKKVVIKIKVA